MVKWLIMCYDKNKKVMGNPGEDMGKGKRGYEKRTQIRKNQ